MVLLDGCAASAVLAAKTSEPPCPDSPILPSLLVSVRLSMPHIFSHDDVSVFVSRQSIVVPGNEKGPPPKLELDISSEDLEKKLRECLASRGRKATDPKVRARLLDTFFVSSFWLALRGLSFVEVAPVGRKRWAPMTLIGSALAGIWLPGNGRSACSLCRRWVTR